MYRDRLNELVRSPILRLGATFVLVAVVVWRSQPQHLASAIPKLGFANIGVAAILTVPFLYLKALRWYAMLRFAGSQATMTEATVSLIGGMGVALITPGRVGEVARVAYLKDARKLRLSALVMLDKFFDVMVLVWLAVPGAWSILGWPAGAALVIAGTAGLLFTLFPHTLRGPIAWLERKVPLGGRTKETFTSLESLSPRATGIYIVLTVVAFAFVILQFGIILRGNTHVSAPVALLTFPLVILTNVLPITVAGIGLREGAAILLLGHYHVPAAIAAISAFTMFFLNTGLPGLVGAFLPLFRRSPKPATPALPVSDARAEPADAANT